MGRLVPAEDTFATRADAGRYLDHVRVQRDQGTWVDPNRGRVLLAEYAEVWLRQRDVRPRTRELYAGLLDHHILPSLGTTPLNRLTPAAIRSWSAELREGERPGRSTAAKSYRLLSSILKTAVEDELIVKNPCILKNAAWNVPPSVRWPVSIRYLRSPTRSSRGSGRSSCSRRSVGFDSVSSKR